MIAEEENPEGWALPSLADVVEGAQSGFASGEKAVKGGLQHLRMNNIGEEGSLVLDLIRTVPRELAKPQHELRQGDVVVCTTNSGKLVGKCALFDQGGEFAFSNHITRLRPKSGLIDSDFLRWSLWLAWKAGEYEELCQHWVNQSTLPKDALLATKIPLPPLAEQRRIVAKVEAMLARVNTARQRLAKVPALLKRFRQSILAAAYSGRLTADWRLNQGLIDESEDKPALWKERHLSELCTGFNYGSSAKSSKEGLIPVLRMGNLQDGKLDWTDLAFTSDSDEIEKYLLRPNTVLFNRTNSPELVGKTAMYRGERPAVFAGYLIRVVHGPELDPHFLNFALNAPIFRDYCASVKTDGVSQSNINAKKLAAYPLNWCPLLEQREIVRRVEALFGLADKIEARVIAATTRSDKLIQATLAKAFRGNLVPTEAELAQLEGREFETAQELLDRLNDERNRVALSPERNGSRRSAPVA